MNNKHNGGRVFNPPTREIRGLENPRSVRENDNRGLEKPRSFEMGKFYNRFAPVDRSVHRLPHLQQGAIFYFVSWCMADSLPQEKLVRWKKERDFWLMCHPEPWDDETENEFHDRFSRAIDEWLDAGEGSCLLRNQQFSKIVADSFMHFNNERYILDSFVVMPNHVHVLFSTISPFTLEQIVKSWKGFTAKEINRILKKSGSFWQEDYWDRMIRSEKHLKKCREYIMKNPSKARLKDGQFCLYTKEGGFSNPPTREIRGLENPRSVRENDNRGLENLRSVEKKG